MHIFFKITDKKCATEIPLVGATHKTWTTLPENYFVLSSGLVNMDQAVQDCKSHGAVVTGIRTQKEKDKVKGTYIFG